MISLTVEPAYGRDYKTKEAMLKDLRQGKDFKGTNPGLGLMGTIFGFRDLETMGVTQLSLRFDKLRKQAIVKVADIAIQQEPKPLPANNLEDLWQAEVDAIIKKELGLGLMDLIDLDLTTPYEEGVTAEEFAEEILADPGQYI